MDGRRYAVRELLGRGGFGTVYRADLQCEGDFSRPVALKMLNEETERVDEVAQRLRDEARMLGLLRHRAIVQVDGLVRLDGRWTVVMEYVDGIDLAALVESGPIPVGPALEIAQEVAAALYVAYDRPTPEGRRLRLLHRDIKPANLQLTAAGEVKVLDFGIAHAEFESREAHTREISFGSLLYMAPERLDFLDGHAGDVYALGATLYELLVGEPLGKTSANEFRHMQVVSAGMKRLERVVKDPEVVGLLDQMLAYEPQNRPTAREIERKIRRLRTRHADVSLLELAETRVTEIRAARELRPDALTGRVLAEATPTAPAPAAAALPVPAPHVQALIPGDRIVLVSDDPPADTGWARPIAALVLGMALSLAFVGAAAAGIGVVALR